MADYDPNMAKQPLFQGQALSDADLAQNNNPQFNQMAQPPVFNQQQQFYQQPIPQQQFQQYPPDQQFQQFPPQQQQFSPLSPVQTQFSQPQMIYVQQPQPVVNVIKLQNLPTNCDGQLNSAKVLCTNCQKEVYTQVTRDVSAFQIMCVIILILFFWPLFWVPLCNEDCYDTTHYCPSCRRVLGRRSR